MRVALVNHQRLQLPRSGRPASSGSIGHFCYEVSTRLARRGECESISVFSPKGGRFATRVTEHEGVRFVEIPTGIDEAVERGAATLAGLARRRSNPARPAFASGWNHALYARRVARALRSLGADLVHVTNRSQFVEPIRRELPGAKIDLHMQCEWLSQLDPALVGPRIDAATWVSGCSEFIAGAVRSAFPRAAEKCFALHNGVDTARFRPRDAGQDARGAHVMFSGRVSPEKGVHDVVAAFARVAAARADARLTIVGPCSSAPFELVGGLSRDPMTRALERFYTADTPYIEQLLATLEPGVAGRVEVVGNVDQEELATRLRSADVCLHPATWHEPFGMAVLEAMATGLPVIATKSGGIPEFVDDGRTGLLVERGAVDALTEALETLLDDPDRRRTLGGAARAEAVERYTWEHVTDHLWERVAR